MFKLDNEWLQTPAYHSRRDTFETTFHQQLTAVTKFSQLDVSIRCEKLSYLECCRVDLIASVRQLNRHLDLYPQGTFRGLVRLQRSLQRQKEKTVWDPVGTVASVGQTPRRWFRPGVRVL